MAKLFANSRDPDQMLHSAASDLGLHCLPFPFYGSPDYNDLRWFGKYGLEKMFFVFFYFSKGD